MNMAESDGVGGGGGGDCKDGTVKRLLHLRFKWSYKLSNPNARRAFAHLKEAFSKAPILPHFDLEGHI